MKLVTQIHQINQIHNLGNHRAGGQLPLVLTLNLDLNLNLNLTLILLAQVVGALSRVLAKFSQEFLNHLLTPTGHPHPHLRPLMNPLTLMTLVQMKVLDVHEILIKAPQSHKAKRLKARDQRSLILTLPVLVGALSRARAHFFQEFLNHLLTRIGHPHHPVLVLAQRKALNLENQLPNREK